MNGKLQNTLFNKYPKIFELHNDEKSCMSRGIECGDGWFPILDALCSKIQYHVDNNDWQTETGFIASLKRLWNKFVYSKLIEPLIKKLPYKEFKNHSEQFYFHLFHPPTAPRQQVKFEQVKEKFGGLTIYANGADYYTHGLIDMAKSMSYYTCEECSSNNNVGITTSNYIMVRCENCSANRKLKKENSQKTFTKVIGRK